MSTGVSARGIRVPKWRYIRVWLVRLFDAAPAAAVQFGATTLSTSPISSRPRRASIMSATRKASPEDFSWRGLMRSTSSTAYTIMSHGHKTHLARIRIRPKSDSSESVVSCQRVRSWGNFGLDGGCNHIEIFNRCLHFTV